MISKVLSLFFLFSFLFSLCFSPLSSSLLFPPLSFLYKRLSLFLRFPLSLPSPFSSFSLLFFYERSSISSLPFIFSLPSPFSFFLSLSLMRTLMQEVVQSRDRGNGELIDLLFVSFAI